MQFFRNLFLMLLLAAPLVLSAQIDDAKGIFRELRSMDGVWFMPTDRGDRLKIWKKQNDSTLVGREVRIKPENGDTVLLETIRLEYRANEVVYSVLIRNQNNNEPVPYTLTTADNDGYVFESATHEDPQKIRYVLLGNREMQVTLEGKRGGRKVSTEYVFEREFAPGTVEFRVRGGINVQNLRGTGNLTLPDKPVFSWRPGWELGTQIAFKGAGGFITVNAEIGLTGRFAHVKSEFFGPYTTKTNTGKDTTYTADFIRDLTYHSIWLNVALTPLITLKRDGKLALVVGPYFGYLIANRGKGTEVPANENKLFSSNNDLKKTEFGIILGFQYKANFGKKDIGGILGLRANLGLSNIDNLYTRNFANSAYHNGQMAFMGASVYYSINLLKL